MFNLDFTEIDHHDDRRMHASQNDLLPYHFLSLLPLPLHLHLHLLLLPLHLQGLLLQVLCIHLQPQLRLRFDFSLTHDIRVYLNLVDAGQVQLLLLLLQGLILALQLYFPHCWMKMLLHSVLQVVTLLVGQVVHVDELASGANPNDGHNDVSYSVKCSGE